MFTQNVTLLYFAENKYELQKVQLYASEEVFLAKPLCIVASHLLFKYIPTFE